MTTREVTGGGQLFRRIHHLGIRRGCRLLILTGQSTTRLINGDSVSKVLVFFGNEVAPLQRGLIVIAVFGLAFW